METFVELLKKAGPSPPGKGWQALSGSKHGGYRRRAKSGKWEYWYPSAAHAKREAESHKQAAAAGWGDFARKQQHMAEAAHAQLTGDKAAESRAHAALREVHERIRGRGGKTGARREPSKSERREAQTRGRKMRQEADVRAYERHRAERAAKKAGLPSLAELLSK